MSNGIRYDSFLVQHLAGELNRELAGRAVTALQFDSSEQRLLADIEDVRLVWDLHPNRGLLLRTAPLYPLADSAILPRRARIATVTAAHDERVLRMDLSGAHRENATFSIVIELLTNHWNAIALDRAGKVLRVLKSRDTGRTFRRGQHYRLPERPDSESAGYRSPLNERLPPARFDQMVAEAPEPALVETGTGVQPYPHHMWQQGARRYATLLSAFAALAGGSSGEAVIRELERRERTVARRMDRLRAELSKAEVAEQSTREKADVLLAYAASVTRGVSRVTLPSFKGGEIELVLDPALSAAENARLLYEAARKQERAIKRIPALLAEAEHSRRRLTTLLERARAGGLSDLELKEIAQRPTPKPTRPAERLPYKRYATSGGLEVRVGRNAKSNDALTLHHSSARDIWLHARQAGGAHVVLRWSDAEANPPLRDIQEAATLAAIHSAARTSRMVPVDYTRRKYVRKPRRAPPGTVVIERAKTVFVEPDMALEERLRARDAQA